MRPRLRLRQSTSGCFLSASSTQGWSAFWFLWLILLWPRQVCFFPANCAASTLPFHSAPRSLARRSTGSTFDLLSPSTCCSSTHPAFSAPAGIGSAAAPSRRSHAPRGRNPDQWRTEPVMAFTSRIWGNVTESARAYSRRRAARLSAGRGTGRRKGICGAYESHSPSHCLLSLSLCGLGLGSVRK